MSHRVKSTARSALAWGLNGKPRGVYDFGNVNAIGISPATDPLNAVRVSIVAAGKKGKA